MNHPETWDRRAYLYKLDGPTFRGETLTPATPQEEKHESTLLGEEVQHELCVLLFPAFASSLQAKEDSEKPLSSHDAEHEAQQVWQASACLQQRVTSTHKPAGKR